MEKGVDTFYDFSYNTAFDKFNTEFLSIFGERYACVLSNEGKVICITVCNHVSNHIRVGNYECHISSKMVIVMNSEINVVISSLTYKNELSSIIQKVS